MRSSFLKVLVVSAVLCGLAAPARAKDAPNNNARAEYTVGVDDILTIVVLQPDQLNSIVTVSPDGVITFPYVGTVEVKGLTLRQIQNKMERELSAYMRYPVMTVSLKESRSRTLYVYGEVAKPGSYPLQQNLTVIRAISMAGGFTKYGSLSQVTVLREKPDSAGNKTIKINIRAAMEGDSRQDIELKAGDIVTVSAGDFSEQADKIGANAKFTDTGYKVGVGDILDISILQPERLNTTLTVSPDGAITFPYIGNVAVKDKTLARIQSSIQTNLANFMQNPVVTVSLKESKNRLFYVYGEVNRPGYFPLQENLTVLRAISMAGGFTKYGSANKVYVLRKKQSDSANEKIKVDIGGAMGGDSEKDINVEPGDVITVSEGVF